MALQIEKALREFKYNGTALPDPDAKMDVNAVKDFYANIYPDLNNAAIEGPSAVGAKMVYEFRRAVGTKGATSVTRLRERLVAQINGDVGLQRGHALTLAQAEAVRPFAAACRELHARRRVFVDDALQERMPAPSELLTPLP